MTRLRPRAPSICKNDDGYRTDNGIVQGTQIKPNTLDG